MTNLLTRYALMYVLDIMMCVFITFASDSDIADSHHRIDMIICYVLVGLLAFLVFFEVVHGAWRYWKARTAKKWNDYRISGYISTLYTGANPQHPERTTLYLVAYMSR